MRWQRRWWTVLKLLLLIVTLLAVNYSSFPLERRPTLRAAGMLDSDRGAITAEHLQAFDLGRSFGSPVDILDLYLLIIFFDGLVGLKVKGFRLLIKLAYVDRRSSDGNSTGISLLVAASIEGSLEDHPPLLLLPENLSLEHLLDILGRDRVFIRVNQLLKSNQKMFFCFQRWLHAEVKLIDSFEAYSCSSAPSLEL